MGEVKVTALRRASIDVMDGEFLVIVGPSGSGKSTLLNMIGGMDRPSSGKVIFEGHNLAQESDKRLTMFRRKEVGFVFQFYNLIPTLTAIENVQVVTEVVPNAMDPFEALKLVKLQDRTDHFPSQLSGGEQQRVSVARALAGNPRLLLCDEPTGALDVETSKEVLGLLTELNQNLGKTIVLITHNNAIAALGKRVAKIIDGAIESVMVNESPTPVDRIKW
jgi:putative ABC transport system ATP-binding protein